MPHLWDIHFDHDGKVNTGVSSRAVKLVPEGSGILLNEESTTTSGSRDTTTLIRVNAFIFFAHYLKCEFLIIMFFYS